MCLELCYRQRNNFSGVLKAEMNTSWAKEKNVISCYKFPDDSLKVCGDETVNFGHPGISGKWLE